MKKLRLSVAVLSVALFATTAQANLLDDGSFEAATNNSDVSNSAWVLSANTPDGTNLSATFSTSVWAASDGDTGVWFKSFEGNQEVGVDPPANATLSQTVTIVPAGEYVLLFDSARETNVTGDSFLVTLSSTSNGSSSIELLTATYNDDGNMNSDPTTFAIPLSLASDDDLTVTVEMVNGVDAQANPQSLMVDNFRLGLIPEPTSLALLGLGAMGALTIRRKR